MQEFLEVSVERNSMVGDDLRVQRNLASLGTVQEERVCFSLGQCALNVCVDRVVIFNLLLSYVAVLITLIASSLHFSDGVLLMGSWSATFWLFSTFL